MIALNEDRGLLPYAEWGNPSSPLVVLLHGLLGDHRVWMPAIQLLANDYCIVAPDLPGHGMNRGPQDAETTIAALAAAVRALIQARDATICAIAGEGLGATIALELALDAPELLAGLALVGLPSGASSGASSGAQLATVERFGTAVAGKEAARGIQDPFLAAGLRSRYSRLDADAFVGCARMLDAWAPPANAVDRIGATPLLVILGEDDPAHPATTAFAGGIADARITELREAADRPLDTRPEAVATALADFLHDVEDGVSLAGHITA